MITRIVQMEVKPGHPADNALRMKGFIRQALSEGVDLIVFPEMAIPGYLIADVWERPAFLRECQRCGEEIRQMSSGISILFGNVGIDWDRRNEDGRTRKYNAAFYAENGAFIGPRNGIYDFVIKTLLPNYREFDDSRHFFDLRKLALEENTSVESMISPVATKHGLLGCILCEDAWDMDYHISPIDLLGAQSVDLFVNISASPFTMNKNHKRGRVFSKHAIHHQRPLLYVNQVGLQNNGKTVYTFDGGSCIYDAYGGCQEASKPFTEGQATIELIHGSPLRLDTPLTLEHDDMATACNALLYGTRQFMELCRVDNVVIGVSGGVDSALVAALYRQILAPERIALINMPSRFNSNTTRTAARDLAASLGCLFADVPIEGGIAETHRQIQGLRLASLDGRHSDALDLSPLVRENIQARDRSSRILAAIASARGGVFTCNANKSEATVGYTTLYGDLGGYLANIADLWKTEVFAMARYVNETLYNSEVIPSATLKLPPSAELSADQNVDEGKGDPLIYPYHDALFRSWVERWERASPDDILEAYAQGSLETEIGYEGRISEHFADARQFIADLERWWNLYEGMGVAKRIQSPPILAIKKRAFGFDHRESQLGPLYTARYKELKASLL